MVEPDALSPGYTVLGMGKDGGAYALDGNTRGRDGLLVPNISNVE